MKNLLFVSTLALVLLSSCVTPKPAMFTTNVDFLDYYTIGHQGKILLTESNSYIGEYTSLGSILITQSSGVIKIGTGKSKQKVKFGVDDDIYGTKPEYKTVTTYKTGDFRQATFSSALEEAVNAAEEMGGDAIINLQFRSQDQETVVVSGMVIKRK